MPSFRRFSRMPKVKVARDFDVVVFGTGPRGLGLARTPERRVGPGEPPPGFVGATTSRSEWYVYWALSVIFNNPRNPRKPPFFGAEDGLWRYQKAALGQFNRQLGSAVVDFVIFLGGVRLALRVQTSRFHISANARIQGYDEQQRRNLGRYFQVNDIYEEQFISDRTGATVIKQVKAALFNGMTSAGVSPIAAGTAIKPRY